MKKYVTQIKVILSVFGDVFDPVSFSKYLKIIPTSFWFKGDEISVGKGLIIKSNIIPLKKESEWEYSTGFVETLYFEEVSELIVDKFEEKIPEMIKYISEKKLDVKIDIVMEIVDEQAPALYFNRRFLDLANQLQTEIHTDIYVFSKD